MHRNVVVARWDIVVMVVPRVAFGYRQRSVEGGVPSWQSVRPEPVICERGVPHPVPRSRVAVSVPAHRRQSRTQRVNPPEQIPNLLPRSDALPGDVFV